MTPIRPTSPLPLPTSAPAGASVASARAAFFSAMGAVDTAPVSPAPSIAQPRTATAAPVQVQPLPAEAPLRPFRPGSLLDIRV